MPSSFFLKLSQVKNKFKHSKSPFVLHFLFQMILDIFSFGQKFLTLFRFPLQKFSYHGRSMQKVEVNTCFFCLRMKQPKGYFMTIFISIFFSLGSLFIFFKHFFSLVILFSRVLVFVLSCFE